MATPVDPSNRGTLDWLNAYVVEPLTSLVTNRIALPVLNKAYSCLGNTAVWLVRKVNGPTADKMQQSLKDPFSTETLLAAGDYFRTVSLAWGRRSPNSSPGVHYFDMCSIIAARHVYIFASDAKVILSAPATLRIKADEICRAAGKEFVGPAEPDEQPALNKRTPFLDEWEAIHGIPKKSEEPAAKALNALRQEAHKLINAREKEVRQKIVGEAVHSACKGAISSTARVAIKVGMAYACHLVVGGSGLLLLSPAIGGMAQNASAGLNLVGACLSLRCSKTADDFYNCRIFDVRASTLRDHALCVGQENIVSIINSITTRFTPTRPRELFDSI